MEAPMHILTNKKPIALVLAGALVMAFLRMPLPASRWQKGSTVEATMTDGRFISGELLAVKGNELIIHDKSIDRGFTVDINQVSEIRIKKKSRVLTGLAIGLIAGLGIGAGIATSAGDDRGDNVSVAMMSISTPFLAATIGGIIGASQSRPKKISVKEQPPILVEWSLRYLEEHARWRNKWKNIYLKNK
jgi:hypothetical protein